MPPARKKKKKILFKGDGPSEQDIQSYYDSYLRSMSTIKPRPTGQGTSEGNKRTFSSVIRTNDQRNERNRINSPDRIWLKQDTLAKTHTKGFNDCKSVEEG